MSKSKAGSPEVGQTCQTDTDDLKAWEATEGFIMKHDVGMVKDYADDVDTLLVFAGLFSAVLTAFVVESYKLLQTDNAENTVKLLARISNQLESFTVNNGFLNSTTAALPPPPKFEPDKTSLWMNVLWFLSLLFSLSAALFGILVKQWLREYLRWNSTLASPRENVLVRQERFESWNEWNMAATISCIPALLEVALIFFVCGLVVLLWTLDTIVAGVITCAAGIFLLIVSSFTLLPVFFKRCPYKSPTAWACLLLWEFFKNTVVRTVILCRLWLSLDAVCAARLRVRLQQSRSGFSSWRERDLANTCISHFADWRGKKHDPVAVVRKEIAAEWLNLSEDGELEGHVPEDSVAIDAACEALDSISQAPVLFRALSWVSQASHESSVQHQVLRCTQSLHRCPILTTEVPLSDALGTHGVRNISIWQLLFLCRSTHSESEDLPPECNDHLQLVQTLRRSTRTLYGARPLAVENRRVTRYELDWRGIEYCKWLFSQYSSCDAQLMSHILAGSLKTTVEELLGEWDVELQGAFIVHGRRAMELLAALQGLLYHTYLNEHPTCVGILLETYNIICASSRKDIFDLNFPGLRCIILEVACRIGVIDVNEHGELIALSIGFWKMSATHFATLAIKLHPDHIMAPRADQHIFVTMADECLWRMKRHDEKLDLPVGVALLDAMCAVTKACLNTGTPNCGYYADLPWLENLCYPSPTPSFLASAFPEGHHELVSALEQSFIARLVTGAGVRARLQVLLGSRRGEMSRTGWKPWVSDDINVPLDDNIMPETPFIHGPTASRPSSPASFREPPSRSTVRGLRPATPAAHVPRPASTISQSGRGNLLRYASTRRQSTREESMTPPYNDPAPAAMPFNPQAYIPLSTFSEELPPYGHGGANRIGSDTRINK